ncbi:hypothetical protein KW797_03030 [Candidatus Parcubacteria bacterium]|nr:hypothetical protein [Candidatus Parcubacteria bacterium]
MPFKCESCRDKKHVPSASGWSPCPQCFSRSEAEHRLEKVPAHLRERGLAALDPSPAVEVLSTVVERLRDRQFPKKFVVLSGAKAKENLIGAFIRDVSLLGLAAERISFQRCVDLYFSAKDEWRRIISASPDVLVLQLGSEILNTASAPVLRELIWERMWSSLYTVLSYDATLLYLHSRRGTPTEFAELLSLPEFKEVLV